MDFLGDLVVSAQYDTTDAVDREDDNRVTVAIYRRSRSLEACGKRWCLTVLSASSPDVLAIFSARTLEALKERATRESTTCVFSDEIATAIGAARKWNRAARARWKREEDERARKEKEREATRLEDHAREARYLAKRAEEDLARDRASKANAATTNAANTAVRS